MKQKVKIGNIKKYLEIVSDWFINCETYKTYDEDDEIDFSDYIDDFINKGFKVTYSFPICESDLNDCKIPVSEKYKRYSGEKNVSIYEIENDDIVIHIEEFSGNDPDFIYEVKRKEKGPLDFTYDEEEDMYVLEIEESLLGDLEKVLEKEHFEQEDDDTWESDYWADEYWMVEIKREKEGFLTVYKYLTNG